MAKKQAKAAKPARSAAAPGKGLRSGRQAESRAQSAQPLEDSPATVPCASPAGPAALAARKGRRGGKARPAAGGAKPASKAGRAARGIEPTVRTRPETGRSAKPDRRATAQLRTAKSAGKVDRAVAVTPESAEPEVVPATANHFPVVGLGASAGGLDALEQFFSHMPESAGMAFVVVAHLDPDRVSLLPDLLRRHTPMACTQVTGNTRVEPNKIYVIPPNRDMALLNRVLQLVELSQPRGLRHSIDYFFRSLAVDQKERAIGVILSGTGTDGTLGLRAIKAEGGMAMVQDPDSAEYIGMPTSAVQTGVADYVLRPEEMPERLINYVQLSLDKPAGALAPAERWADALQKIIILLRSRTGNDLALYKKTTVWRRVTRRMSVHRLTDPRHYVQLLQDSPDEAQTLFKEILIGVTNFFRDPEAFVLLKKELAGYVAGRQSDNPIRVWVAGSSSGEEAYSIAMLLQEIVEEKQADFQYQIFATDLDKDAIDMARTGSYPVTMAADVEPTRLKRFFVRENSLYRIKKEIRERIIFSVHNIIKDPPFMKLDLLCCRNLLIYLEPELQKKLVPLFAYTLNPGGILFLGPSETVSGFGDLFACQDRKHKVYRKRETAVGINVPGEHVLVPAERLFFTDGRGRERIALASSAPLRADGSVWGTVSAWHDVTDQELLLGELEQERARLNAVIEGAPVGIVVVDEHCRLTLANAEAESLIGQPVPYGEQLKILSLPVICHADGSACKTEELPLWRSVFQGATVENEEIEILLPDGRRRFLLVNSSPIRDAADRITGAIGVFRDVTSLKQQQDALRRAHDELEVRVEDRTQGLAEAVDRLVDEVRERKRAEKALEEQAELLGTVFANVHFLVAYLDADFNFIRVNEAYAQAGGHPPEFYVGKNHFELYPHEENLVIFRRVLAKGEPYVTYEKAFSNPDQPGRGLTYWDWSLRPVWVEGKRVGGLVLTLVDVTARRLAQEQLRAEHDFRVAVEESVPAGIAAFDSEGRLMYFNRAFKEMLGWEEAALLGSQPPFRYWSRELAGKYGSDFQELLRGGSGQVSERVYRRQDGKRLWVLVSGTVLRDRQGNTMGLLETVLDVSERKDAELALEESEKRYRDLVEASPDGMVVTIKGQIVYANPAALALVGASEFKEIALRAVVDFVHQAHRDKTAATIAGLEASRRKRLAPSEIKLVRLDGQVLDAEFTATRTIYNRQLAVQSIFRDVRERKRAEERVRYAETQIRQTEKLASLGMLVSAIAHEINNPNNFILMNLPTLRDYLQRIIDLTDGVSDQPPSGDFFGMSYEEFREDLDKLLANMEHGAQRIGDTIAKLKRFVQYPDSAERRLVSLKKTVQMAADMCRVELSRHGVRRLELEVPDDLVAMTLGEDLEMILINVLINAAHAADKGADAWVKVSARDGDPMVLEVADNGTGMDEEIRKKAFEPFFTTKPGGQGTGLGLYVCQDLAESLGARLELESEPGKGTRFRLLLPKGERALR